MNENLNHLLQAMKGAWLSGKRRIRAARRKRLSFDRVNAQAPVTTTTSRIPGVQFAKQKPKLRLNLYAALAVYTAAAILGVTAIVFAVRYFTRTSEIPPVNAMGLVSPSPTPSVDELYEGTIYGDEADPIFDWEVGDVPTYIPQFTPEPSPDPYAQLNPGETNERVMSLQERLMELDYMEMDEPTDFYGFVTQYSVQLFQREHALQVDGVAGQETLMMLMSDEAKKYVVRIGDRGTDVLEMQKQLYSLGYLKAKPNGIFGDQTEEAVKAFQKRNNLTVDGVIGMYTREALYSEKARPAPTPKPTPSPTPKRTPTPKPGTTPKKTSATATPKKATATPKKAESKGNDVDALIAFAKDLVGSRYVRGAKGPSKFDCSGFVYYCLKNSGVSLSYMTSGGWLNSGYKTISSMSDLKAGDIVCFKGHVGIYLGSGGRMIDASSSQGKVRITGDIRENSYWTKNFICAKRVY